MRFTRDDILLRLNTQLEKDLPIIGAPGSAGIIARCCELGGADLIVTYSVGKSRILGLPTTLIGHPNTLTLSMYDEIANVVRNTPIIGGIEACDPTNLNLDALLGSFFNKGFDGVINLPTVRLAVGKARESLGPALGIPWGIDREVELIRMAHEKYNWFTIAFVTTPSDAVAMAEAGADMVCANVGKTGGAVKMDEALESAQGIFEATREVNHNVICVGRGGPFVDPIDTEMLYKRTIAQGYFGGSSIEKIPVERAVLGCVQAFKESKLR